MQKIKADYEIEIEKLICLIKSKINLIRIKTVKLRIEMTL